MKPAKLFDALLAISDAFNSVRETPLLLQRIMEISMETLNAERGFILLKAANKDGFEAVTARNISDETIASIQDLSSSIVNQVLESGEAVIAIDAQTDDRFAGAESVVLQNIRSVICTPLVQGDQMLGAIYMDTRASSGKFDRESLEFLQTFAQKAATAIDNARLIEALHRENQRLRKQVEWGSSFPEIIGRSQPIRKMLAMIEQVADTNASVLIEGESGTGKELVARALHYHSSRKDNLFIPIFCGSLAENLLESELFGHKKGAFTGAIDNKSGLFEDADAGTLFLDEIADISKNIQTKLLRVLQEGEIKRVGENKIRSVDVRIVSATNKDLWQSVEDGEFREDLFYRLNVINIKMPPLRTREGDIPLLANHFLTKYAQKNGKTITGFSTAAMEQLEDYRWPGNIRELENTIERAVILARNDIISEEILHLHRPSQGSNTYVGKPLKEAEKEIILQTLEFVDGNRTRAAEMLDVSRRWLQYRLKEWGIADGD